MMIPKVPPIKSPGYLAWVRSLPCGVDGCGQWSCAHHLIGDGHGRVGSKRSDVLAMPLCHDHHMELHQGYRAFEKKYEYSQWGAVMSTLGEAIRKGVL